MQPLLTTQFYINIIRNSTIIFLLSYIIIYPIFLIFIFLNDLNKYLLCWPIHLLLFFCFFITFILFCIIVIATLRYLSNLKNAFKFFSGAVFAALFIWSLYLWAQFDSQCIGDFGFHYIYKIGIIEQYNIEFTVGIDGLSLCFLLLTTFIMMLCWSAAQTQQKNYKSFIICLLLIEIFLILSFIVIDLLFFYVFFESVLIPMFIIIGYWGSRSRKIRAAYYFFLYTLFGSLFMLFGILYIYLITNSTDFFVLLNQEFSQEQQTLLWFCFFIPFAIKIPMFPFHIWLPEAHVEAPTIGSIILASLLLKLGGYGFLRFTLPLFPEGNQIFLPIVYSLAVASVVYASLITLRQIDLKRIIAYSSVAHMNLLVLGLFSYTEEGIIGAIYLMIGHGFVSSALFFCVGVIYDRHQTRLLHYYGGLGKVMPLFAMFFFFFTLANMGFPGTSNFVGELLILSGIFETNSNVMVFSALGIIFSAIYSIWLYNRLVFGTLKIWKFEQDNKINILKPFDDLTKQEFNILLLLTITMFFFGFSAELISELLQTPISLILKK